MRVAEKASPVAAVIAALSTLACCLPFGFIGALGLAGVSVWAAKYRPWLMGAAVLFLAVGGWQLYRGKSCERRSKASIITFWAAVAVVLMVLIFPQVIASVLAG